MNLPLIRRQNAKALARLRHKANVRHLGFVRAWLIRFSAQ